MTSTNFMTTVLCLSFIGIIASMYVSRVPKKFRQNNHPMWILDIGFIGIFLFAVGVTLLGWDATSAKYVLVIALLCSTIYVVVLAIDNYFAKQQNELKVKRELAYRQKLGMLENGLEVLDRRSDKPT